jgi:regulator of RNase E activity RraA
MEKDYSKFYTGLIYDVLKFGMEVDNFVLPRDLLPAWNFKGNIFGRAFTVVGRKSTKAHKDNATTMVETIAPGDVLIMQANDNSRAHFGDITARMVMERGCAGAVIQGWTRDIERIEDLGFKLWCKGVQPQNSKDRWIVEDVQCEIVIGNIFITPSDYIFADRDGILVIRSSDVNYLISKCYDKLREEDIIIDKLQRGISPTEIKKRFGQW